jgi:hypothetical protein
VTQMGAVFDRVDDGCGRRSGEARKHRAPEETQRRARRKAAAPGRAFRFLTRSCDRH